MTSPLVTGVRAAAQAVAKRADAVRQAALSSAEAARVNGQTDGVQSGQSIPPKSTGA